MALILVLALGAIAVSAFAGNLPIMAPTATITPTPTVVTKQVTSYLVPVVKFTTVKTNYTLAEVQAAEPLLVEGDSELLPDDWQTLVTEVSSLDELKTGLAGGKIGLLPPASVTPDLKTISIDGQNFWAKDADLAAYPLQKTVTVPETDTTTTNYDKTKSFTIFAGGEIIPARAVDRLSLNKNNNYTYLFDYFLKDITTADLAIAMLENPLVGNPTPCTGCTNFIGDEQNAKGFATVGLDFIAASGNHMGNAGNNGYPNTRRLLEENGIQATGLGKGDDEQYKPAIKELNGLRIGMISADDIAYFYWDHSGKSYGINSFSSDSGRKVDLARVKKIAQIKADNNIDYLIIYESWGVEYTNKPTKHQEELAHALLDNGADMIIASHPHWVQSIEFYKDKPIIYSLGNFIFDQTHTLQTRQSTAANLYYYQNELKAIELMPIQTCGYHQTKTDLTSKYLAGEISLTDVYNSPEKSGCVYWQPKKLNESHPSYKEILERIFQYTKV